MPPTSFGLAFLMVSCICLLSSSVGFYSQLIHFRFITHVLLLLTSLIGQLPSTLPFCVEIEAERGAMAKKSSRSAGQLLKRKRNPWQMPAKIDEVKAKEFGGKMQSKYGQWGQN
ncbi:hypothetical protein CICLE_v10030215mg [Citrus x clementina]|uniref:Uncharacterized protein n=2 Tax=Citrus TaxID=2706 RepID=A0ACB8ITV9_CITSI|nr:hypothetical protein CICLE_v10030215mg [Citrus x clementina]KAH9700349.1 hypothetical protein KPL71_024660 [Citrus sinensis]